MKMIEFMKNYEIRLINFPNQYKTIHCKSTNKSSVCDNLYHTYHNSWENINQFIYKFTKKTFYSAYVNQRFPYNHPIILVSEVTNPLPHQTQIQFINDLNP